jgi:hypothetical protein
MTVLDFGRQWTILSGAADETSRFAALELRDLLMKVSGEIPELDRSDSRAQDDIILLSHSGGSGGGYSWRAGTSRVEIFGDGPKGLVNGVYSFLHAMGCRWLVPGQRGERVPSSARVSLSVASERSQPAIGERCLVVSHPSLLGPGQDWILWAARNGMDSILFRLSADPLSQDAIAEDAYLRHRDSLIPLAKRCGLKVGVGGFILERVAGRAALEESAGESAVERATQWFSRYAEADSFHLWPREGERLDDSLLAELSSALEEASPQASLALRVTDQESLPRELPANACLEYFPESRCHAHPLADPSCAANPGPEALRALAAASRDGERPTARFLGQWADSYAFAGVEPPLFGVMTEDLRALTASGFVAAQFSLSLERSAEALNPMPWLFARLAWDPLRDPGAELGDFCAATYGPGGPAMAAFFGKVESAFALALESDGAAPPRGDLAAPAAYPPSSGFDGFLSDLAFLERKCGRKERVFAALEEAKALLDAAESAITEAAAARVISIVNRSVEARLGGGEVRPDREGDAAAETLSGYGSAEPPRTESPEQGALARRRADSHMECLNAERLDFSLTETWLEFDALRAELLKVTKARSSSAYAATLELSARLTLAKAYRWGRKNLPDLRERRSFSFLLYLYWQTQIDLLRRDSRWNYLKKGAFYGIASLACAIRKRRMRSTWRLV